MAALRESDSFFEGTIQHVLGGEVAFLTMVLDKKGEAEMYFGRWFAMGRQQTFVLTIDKVDSDTSAVTIISSPTLPVTVLRGTLDAKSGCIAGEALEDGVTSGHFHLKPTVARVELTDTDGDHLVFVRVLGAGIAEYCNGKLVVASLKQLEVNESSGYCNDGGGSFTIRAEDRASKLQELKFLLSQADVPVMLGRC